MRRQDVLKTKLAASPNPESSTHTLLFSALLFNYAELDGGI